MKVFDPHFHFNNHHSNNHHSSNRHSSNHHSNHRSNSVDNAGSMDSVGSMVDTNGQMNNICLNHVGAIFCSYLFV